MLLDTNVLVAAFATSGSCHELLEHCFRSHEIVTSRHLLAELEKVLGGKLGFGRQDCRDTIEIVARMTTMVEPTNLPSAVCRDPDDDHVLAAAVAAAADCIVTGDRDLLCLGRCGDVRILDPDGFWRFERE